eukprot:TRINITY_DN23327_c0_g1_i1.p1 TRINITY_DN23327_c0_g1~~TRINITY_DN23327_c0_g1_i1.p1  ORF type:complete len:812 (-),score=158.45 TRINITY_DN23327_c0_g1_i1:73-2508(-)
MASPGPFLVDVAGGLEVKGRQRFAKSHTFDNALKSLSARLAGGKYKSIPDLDLSQNPLTTEQFRELFSALELANVHVLRFRLFGCATLNDDVMEIIGSYFSTLPADKAPAELHLSDCAITSVGFCNFMSALEGSDLYASPEPNMPSRKAPLYIRLENNFIDESIIQAYIDGNQIKPFTKRGSRLVDIEGPKVLLVVTGVNAGFQQKLGDPPPPEEAPPPKAVNDGNALQASCRWCQMGECWTHQQVTPPKATPVVCIQQPTTNALPVGPLQGNGKAPKQAGKVGQIKVAPVTPLKVTPVAKAKQVASVQPDCKWCNMGQCWTHGKVKAETTPAGPAVLPVGCIRVPTVKPVAKAMPAVKQTLSPAVKMPAAKTNCKWCQLGQCWTHEAGAEEDDGLPPNWEEHFSDEFQVPFYFNVETGESVWVKPEGGKRKAASVEPGGGSASKKRKVDVSTGNICWDFVKNQCNRGDACPFDHSATTAMLSVKAHEGSQVKGRTDEERQAAKAMYAMWAEERLVRGADPTGSNADSADWWYCQVCLVCLKECDWNVYSKSHQNSNTHRSKFMKDGGYMLKPGVLRPDPELEKPLEVGTIPRFTTCTGMKEARVLTLGEQDYSFSLAVARQQFAQSRAVSVVASSYLAAHDPTEPEVHVRDDGMRAHYSRRSLPNMDGALQKNIDMLNNLGGVVLHSVDATDLPGTLLSQYGETYDLIIFPFPRASLQRGCQPKNPSLIRNFFRSVNDARILDAGGKIGIVLLRSQYAEWDLTCVAMEAGYQLVDQAALPDGFYQGREMSGKIFDSWKKIGAEIYMFQLA